MAKLMNGTYYEITGGMSEDSIINLNTTDMTDREAIKEAQNTERVVYKNTYENGKRTISIKLYDPYGDAFYLVGTEELYYEPIPREKTFEYQMLGRLRSDCEYFLGNGNGYEGHLWAGSVEKQIDEMKRRWLEFTDDEKPEWLSWKDIERYELQMILKREQRKERTA